jgi:hypothetical protein
MMLPIVLVIDRPWQLAPPALTSWAAILALALVCTALAYVLYFRILATAGATNLTLVTFLIPVSAIVLGVVILGERLEPRQLAGMTLIAVGSPPSTAGSCGSSAAACLGVPPDSTDYRYLAHAGVMACSGIDVLGHDGSSSGRMLGVLRWLVALYVLSVCIPVIEAAAARDISPDAAFVDLCTVEGVKRVALNPDGQPIDPTPARHHGGHDCPGCFAGCAQGALCGELRGAVPLAWPRIVEARLPDAALAAPPLAARAPLPARGPPSLS